MNERTEERPERKVSEESVRLFEKAERKQEYVRQNNIQERYDYGGFSLLADVLLTIFVPWM